MAPRETLRDQIRAAWSGHDSLEFGRLTDALALAMGFNDEQVRRFVGEVVGEDIPLPTWDTMLHRAEWEEGLTT
jgi:hypothetical protein